MPVVVNGPSVTYSGVSFTNMYKTTVASRPVYDDAGRATVYVEHTIEVDGYVQSPTGTDTTMAQLRKLLTQPGGTLIYGPNKGFGTLSVNAGGPVKDCVWGPKPELLQFVPLGGDACGQAAGAKVRWRVTTRIPECDTARYQFAVLALNYSVVYELDQDGYTVQTISGYVEIPMTRVTPSSRVVPDTADRYRSLVRPEVPAQFQRTKQSFRLSLDKRRLDFTFVDVEMPSALPDYCTTVNARHRVRSSLAGLGFESWEVSVEATITLARGRPKADALAIFWQQVLGPRVARLKAQLGAALIPQEFELEDDMYGRTASFRFRALAKGAALETVLGASNMWKAVAHTNYSRWSAQVRNYSHSERGWAGLAHDPRDDGVVDLCLAGPTGKIVSRENGQPPPVDDAQANIISQQFSQIVADVTAELSWLFYWMELVWVEWQNIVPHKRQPAPPPAGGPTGGPTGPDFTLPPTGPILKPSGGEFRQLASYQGAPQPANPLPNQTPDRMQRTATPTKILLLRGLGLRLLYRVPVPELLTVGGVKVVELGRMVSEDVPGSLGGVPIFRTEFLIAYYLPDVPKGNFPVPPNPARRTDGTAGNSGGKKV